MKSFACKILGPVLPSVLLMGAGVLAVFLFPFSLSSEDNDRCHLHAVRLRGLLRTVPGAKGWWRGRPDASQDIP